jgi:hypothetical protein
MNMAFILRLTWDSESQLWCILLKPVDGRQPRVFVDLESAFLYVTQLTDHQTEPKRFHL